MNEDSKTFYCINSWLNVTTFTHICFKIEDTKTFFFWYFYSNMVYDYGNKILLWSIL